MGHMIYYQIGPSLRILKRLKKPNKDLLRSRGRSGCGVGVVYVALETDNFLYRKRGGTSLVPTNIASNFTLHSLRCKLYGCYDLRWPHPLVGSYLVLSHLMM